MSCCLYTNTQFTIEQQIGSSMIVSLDAKSNHYLVIRIIFGLWTWITTIYSLWWIWVPNFYTIYDSKNCCIQYWPIYFTHWGLIFVSLYWIIIIYLHFKVGHGNLLTISICNSFIIFMMRLTYITGFVFSIIIVPVFWFTVYDGNTDPNYLFLSINQHGITMIIIVIEWYLNLIQIKWSYIFFPVINGIIYIGLLILHYLQNWTDSSGKHYYVYSIVDFHTDFIKSCIVSLAIVCIGCIIFIIMAMIKIAMVNRYSKHQIDYINDKLPSQPEP